MTLTAAGRTGIALFALTGATIVGVVALDTTPPGQAPTRIIQPATATEPTTTTTTTTPAVVDPEPATIDTPQPATPTPAPAAYPPAPTPTAPIPECLPPIIRPDGTPSGPPCP